MSDAEKAAELVRRLGEIGAECLDPSAVQDDAAQVAGESVRRSHAVVEELVRLGPAAVEPLLSLLDDGKGTAPLSAATALGQIGDLRAVEPLLHKLEARNIAAFGVYAISLSKIGDPRAVEPLIAVLEHAEERTAQDIARNNAEYGTTVGKRLAGRIGRFMARRWFREMDEYNRTLGRVLYCRFAAAALGTLGDARAVEPLKRCRNDADPRVREAVEQALTRLNAA